MKYKILAVVDGVIMASTLAILSFAVLPCGWAIFTVVINTIIAACLSYQIYPKSQEK